MDTFAICRSVDGKIKIMGYLNEKKIIQLDYDLAETCHKIYPIVKHIDPT